MSLTKANSRMLDQGYVDITTFGAVGDGVTDCSAALQSAIDTGKPIYIPTGTFYIATGATGAGAIVAFGDGDNSILTSDGGPVLFSAAASNSSLRDFRIERKTNPTTVVRDWGSWTTSAVGTTGEGYMPGPNDNDGVWAGLTAAQQSEIGSYIHLVGASDASGTYGKNISVENISSKFGSIIIENCEYVTVRGCRLHGERASAGCIWIKNYQARDNGAGLAEGVVIDGNICEFSAYNGISVDATNGAIISNNITGYCSETGIKLWQDGPSPAASSRGNFRTVITGNTANYSFEDGYNISSRYPNADTDATYYQAVGNYAYGNNSAGFVVDGKFNLINNNHSQGNSLDGIVSNASYSLFSGNYQKDNNASNAVSGRNEFTNNGSYNTIANNYSYRSTTRNGVGFYMGNTETLNMIGNTSIGPSLGISYDSQEVLNSIGNYANGVAKASSTQEFRSDASTTDSVNIALTQASAAGNTVAITFKPRSTMTNECATVEALLASGVAGSETGELHLQTRITGTNSTKAKVDFNGNWVSGTNNTYALGNGSNRWTEVFATNGTINTSDREQKQDIRELTTAETAVAISLKPLLRAYRWQDAVETKGDNARIHFGIIAQDVAAAFTAEGLDASDYGIFCSDTWTDDDGNEQTSLGVRYTELLAFIIAAT